MKYRVIRNCYGFQGRYWSEGDIVEISPSENPPEHFKPIDPMPDKVEPKKHTKEKK